MSRPQLPMSPIVWAGGATLVGTLAVHQLPALPEPAWWPALALAALLALRRPATRPLVWLIAAVAWTSWSANERLSQRLPFAALGADFAVTGFVDAFPSVALEQTTFSFSVAEPRPAGVPGRLRLTWYNPPLPIAAGSPFALTVRLRPPHGARNPGGFDYEQWLLVNDYGATGYVRAGTAGPDPNGVRARWQHFRAELAERILAVAGEGDGAALLTALALGERYLFSDQHWADFRRTGTSHLVAVSGMHVALLGLAVFAALRWLWLRLPSPLNGYDLEIAALASVAATAYYAALTGFAVPAERSLVMVAVGLAVLVSRRSVSAAQVLAATLLAVIWWDPFAPLAASFWLSFVAVAILVALAAPRSLRVGPATSLRRAGRSARQFVAWQWWIGLALLPLTVAYFGEISLVGPLVNLVAIPLFNGLLVPLAVLTAVTQSIDVLAGPLAAVAELAAAAAGSTVAQLHAVATLPGVAPSVPQPPWPAFAVAGAGVACAVCAPPLRVRHWGWLALAPLFFPAPALPPHGAAHAVVLDVGHGLAVLVETRSHRLLFDAGPTSRGGFDSGADLVVPALAARGRRGLDLLVVSHADNDHAGGAPAVAAAFPTAAVLKGPDVQGLPGQVCARGQRWEWDGVRFEILHPPPAAGAAGNDSSCVLKVTTEQHALLITGDIERRGEGTILGQPLAADVVVVPHHGSATSSSASFVAAVGADYAIASAGFANRWGFPRPDVRQRWEAAGAALLVTGDSGAVTVALGAEGVEVFAERDGRHRYWQKANFHGESIVSAL